MKNCLFRKGVKKEMLLYKMDVLTALKEKGYNTNRLRKENLLGENAIQSLRKNKMIGMIALEKICFLLNVQPGDIIRFVQDPPADPDTPNQPHQDATGTLSQ